MKTEKEIRMKLAEIILTYNDLKSHGMLTSTMRPKLTGQKEILQWVLRKENNSNDENTKTASN